MTPRRVPISFVMTTLSLSALARAEDNLASLQTGRYVQVYSVVGGGGRRFACTTKVMNSRQDLATLRLEETSPVCGKKRGLVQLFPARVQSIGHQKSLSTAHRIAGHILRPIFLPSLGVPLVISLCIYPADDDNFFTRALTAPFQWLNKETRDDYTVAITCQSASRCF